MSNDILNTFSQPTIENTVAIGDLLPCSSFIGFDGFRLKNTELLWVNNALLNDLDIQPTQTVTRQILDNYSYVSSSYTNTDKLNLDDQKVFLADRYGSRHEVCNGGSARCGLNGHFQIKGIGTNPLLAQNMDQHHAHGKLFIDEAISEAVWGEICNKHLPYGAIRTLAIIKTNVTQEYTHHENLPLKPCALAIREFAIRPAHFERCTFFWPSESHMYLRDNDALRVSESIPLLSKTFNKYLSYHEKQSQTGISETLKAIVTRIAKQIAYSRIKGIPHGSLTSSNISIDGRFLDFGTISAVPDFANYVLANGVGAIWDDHHLVVNWIQNLAITINYYTDAALLLKSMELNQEATI